MQSNPQLPQSGSGGPQPAYSGEDFTPGSVNSPPSSPAASKAPANPNSTQNALLISEIRDGIVIMNDGTFRAVIMCKSINFDLMSPQEREAVEFSYQGFLNSLYFPVQIFVRSQKVDLRPYLERMDKIRTEQENMLLGLLMEDYIAFLSDISQQTNIMDKKFYLVIKYPDTDQDIRKAIKQSTSFFTGLGDLMKPSKPVKVTINEAVLETAKTELRNRVQAAMQGLAQSGVQSLPLDTEELIELYYDVYNPDTATRQQIKNFNDLTAPIITKGDDNMRPAAAGETV
jgi:type IV secretory pathway VirB4 component